MSTKQTLFYCCFKNEETGTEGLSNLLKATQPVNGKAVPSSSGGNCTVTLLSPSGQVNGCVAALASGLCATLGLQGILALLC